jgi:hypothetical protein
MDGVKKTKVAGRRPFLGRAKRDLRRLEELEESGEGAAAPYIAIGEVALALIPVFLLMLGVALAAYYLA